MKPKELTPEAMMALKRQIERFKEKFGRDPLPHEPVFFDPDYNTPVAFTRGKLEEIITEVALKAKKDGKLFPTLEETIDYFLGAQDGGD